MAAVTVASILDSDPLTLSRDIREAVADAHFAWRRAVERVPARVYTLKINGVDAAPLVAKLTPGDRGLSRDVEDRLPRSVRQAIDRRIRAAQVAIDALPGTARAAADVAFADLDRRVRDLTRQYANGRGELPKGAERQINAALNTEFRRFEDNLRAQWTRVLKRSTAAGTNLADVPVRILGLRPRGEVTPPDPFNVDQLFGTLTDRFSAKTQRELARTITRVRQGDMGMEQAIFDVTARIREPRHSAERIMRTESGRASTAATDLRMKQHGETLRGLEKEWVSALTSETRNAHLTAHGQIVGVNEDFIVGGESAAHPKDARLSAGNSVNCLCLSSPKVDNAEIDV